MSRERDIEFAKKRVDAGLLAVGRLTSVRTELLRTETRTLTDRAGLDRREVERMIDTLLRQAKVEHSEAALALAELA